MVVEFNRTSLHSFSSTSWLCYILKFLMQCTHVSPPYADVQDGKSGCYNSGIRREVGKSTFGNMDDSLRTGLYTFNYFWLEYLLHGSSRVRKLGRTIDK